MALYSNRASYIVAGPGSPHHGLGATEDILEVKHVTKASYAFMDTFKDDLAKKARIQITGKDVVIYRVSTASTSLRRRSDVVE